MTDRSRLDVQLAGGWTKLGFLDSITPADPDPTPDHLICTTPESLEMTFNLADDITFDTFFPPPPTTSVERSLVMEFPYDQDPGEIRGMFGGVKADRSVTFHTAVTVPDLPQPPSKTHRLRGKRYRIARRRYGRAVRAWKKAGRPTRTTAHRVHIPRASIAPDGPNTYTVTPLSTRSPLDAYFRAGGPAL